ncbi:MAG: hypothetical protein ACYS18_00120 [Planctomycetota bacterium]|jgi:hypothetical protein
MAIALHCEHCGKKIEAPDSAGGKWGKCPACHNKVYVPSLDADEELKLAPVDESEKEKQQRLLAETNKLRQDILSENEEPPETNEVFPQTPAFTETAGTSTSDLNDKDLTIKIISYLRQMADGELERAETMVSPIAACGSRALQTIDKIALSKIPEPELADIPSQILSGLIRTLRSKIV